MPAEALTASIHIAAQPDQVFPYFTRPDAIVRWMGEHARLDPREGGEFTVDIRGVPVRGRYLEVDPPHRLRISWGHAGSERLPPGASLLEVTLLAVGGGTLVEIVHSGLPEPEATRHAAGWHFFLRRLRAASERAASSAPSTTARPG
jgi:uncharacterized protein YndB with AHSA1/START domain